MTLLRRRVRLPIRLSPMAECRCRMLYTQTSCGANRDHLFSTILLADRSRALLH
jgi:hypothetical protein